MAHSLQTGRNVPFAFGNINNGILFVIFMITSWSMGNSEKSLDRKIFLKWAHSAIKQTKFHIVKCFQPVPEELIQYNEKSEQPWGCSLEVRLILKLTRGRNSGDSARYLRE